MLVKKRFYQIILFILYIGLLLFYIFESCKNQTSSHESSSFVSSFLGNVIEFVTGKDFVISKEFDFFIRKFVGHFLYFVCLGTVSILLYFSFANKMKMIIVFGLIHFFSGFIFAFISEYVLQLISIGRYPSIGDVVLDYLGFIFVSGIIFNFYYSYFLKKEIQFNYLKRLSNRLQ